MSPYVDLDTESRTNRQKESPRQRWTAFKVRNFHDEYEDAGGQQATVSGPQLHVLGERMKGGLVMPYERKGKEVSAERQA